MELGTMWTDATDRKRREVDVEAGRVKDPPIALLLLSEVEETDTDAPRPSSHLFIHSTTTLDARTLRIRFEPP